MFHGISKIIRKTSIDEDHRLVFLEELQTTQKHTHYFEMKNPQTPVEIAIMEFLDRQGFGCSKKYVEYWFQSKIKEENLWPHVDFNEVNRVRLANGESISPERLMSPITIACYLESQNLIGGELCISQRSWLDYEREIQPPEDLHKELCKYIYETYKPTTGDVLYFQGSRYYHWINRVLNGTRKSMLINFWDEIDK